MASSAILQDTHTKYLNQVRLLAEERSTLHPWYSKKYLMCVGDDLVIVSKIRELFERLLKFLFGKEDATSPEVIIDRVLNIYKREELPLVYDSVEQLFQEMLSLFSESEQAYYGRLKQEWMEASLRNYATTNEDVSSLCYQACFYRNGWGVETDETRAEQLCLQAVHLCQNSEHEENTQIVLGLGVYCQQKELYEEAAKLFHQVEDHEVVALRLLSELYLHGRGVEKSKKVAAKYAEKAAKAGDAPSQLLFGTFCAKGIGEVEKDLLVAVEWWKKAAEQNLASAQYKLGIYFLKNGEKIRGLEWLKRACEQNFSKAYYSLGYCYVTGLGVEKNEELAEQFFTKAVVFLEDPSTKSSRENAYRLAKCYEKGWGVEADLQRAIDEYTRAADRGHFKARIRLGDLYTTGKGVDIDLDLASKFYKEAFGWNQQEVGFLGTAVNWCTAIFNKGHAAVFYRLGKNYENNQNIDKAYKYYKQAAREDHADACFAVGRLCKDLMEDLKGAFYWFKKASKMGHADASWQVGQFLEMGTLEEPNLQEALQFYNEAAEKDHLEALYRLGCYYLEQKNYQEAAGYFAKGAELKDKRSTYQAAFCYGMVSNEALSVYWHQKSAEQGHKEAQFVMGNYTFWGQRGVVRDLIQAAQLWELAAIQDHVEAQYLLANCYLAGRGRERNYFQAARWYRSAAEKGHSKAAFKLGVCLENGWGVDRNLRDAKWWLWLGKEEVSGDYEYHMGIVSLLEELLVREKAYLDDAASLLMKAVEKGHAKAAFYLFFIEDIFLCRDPLGRYYSDNAFYRDFRTKIRYLEKAKVLGHAVAETVFYQSALENSSNRWGCSEKAEFLQVEMRGRNTPEQLRSYTCINYGKYHHWKQHFVRYGHRGLATLYKLIEFFVIDPIFCEDSLEEFSLQVEKDLYKMPMIEI